MSSSFKFVDKRRFTEEGELKEGAKETPRSSPPPQAAPADIPKASAPRDASSSISFATFTQSLAHQTLMALGMVPWPDSHLIEQRLEVAKDTIDILSMLQDKTKGNLSAEEARMLEGILYELRMMYVQTLKGELRPSPSSPHAPHTPSS